jgi:Flp pilus assembly protein TadG
MSPGKKSMFRFFPSRFPARYAATGLRQLKGECGNALIEYALVFILFLMILFGITGFGHAVYVYHFVSNAAREATRYAAVRGSTCSDDGSCAAANSASGTAGPTSPADISAFVKNITPLGINLDPSVLTTTLNYPVQANGPTFCTTTQNEPGCTVQVTVSYNFHFIFPLIPTASVPMSSSSEMVIVH